MLALAASGLALCHFRDGGESCCVSTNELTTGTTRTTTTTAIAVTAKLLRNLGQRLQSRFIGCLSGSKGSCASERVGDNQAGRRRASNIAQRRRHVSPRKRRAFPLCHNGDERAAAVRPVRIDAGWLRVRNSTHKRRNTAVHGRHGWWLVVGLLVGRCNATIS